MSYGLTQTDVEELRTHSGGKCEDLERLLARKHLALIQRLCTDPAVGSFPAGDRGPLQKVQVFGQGAEGEQNVHSTVILPHTHLKAFVRQMYQLDCPLQFLHGQAHHAHGSAEIICIGM